MKKILMVDDEQKNINTAKIFFTLRGYESVEANDGIKALEQIKKHGKFDLILTDIEMPNMNGYELLSRVRRDAANRSTPVIVLSSLSDSASLDKAKRLGASSYIVKPLDRGKLEKAFDEVGI